MVEVLLPIGSHNITLWGLSDGVWYAAPEITVAVSDVPATANAGDDQTVTAAGATTDVTLDGSGSTGAVSYSWTLGGTEIGTEASITYGFPVGVHEVTLTVTSVGGVPDSDTVTVTVLPVAEAGEDQTVDADSDSGALVDLDGTGSIGDGYSWRVDGQEIATGLTPAGVAFDFGTTEVTLVVSSGELEATDTVSITVNPVADAGDDQTLAATSNDGADVSLGGVGSYGTDLSWQIGGTEIANGMNPDAVEFPIGITEVTLVVSGAEGQDPATDTVTITINPVAVAGGGGVYPITSPEGAAITLDGSASFAGPESTFTWTIDGEEVATGAEAEIVLPVGEYEITLTVSGPGEVSDSDTIVVEVVAPYLSAEATQREWGAETAEGALVTLDGSLSTIEDEAEFAWWEDCTTLDCGSTGGFVLVPNSPDALVAEVVLPIGAHNITLWARVDGVWHQAEEIVVTVYPVADAGDDQVVASENGVDAEVTLDGSGSIGDLESIEWVLDEEVIATGPEATVTLEVGTHEITLIIYGPDDVSAEDTVTIVVAAAPTADAGEDQTVKATSDEGAEVTLDGSGSTAAGDAEIVSWVWTVDGEEIASGETAEALLPIGTTTVTLTVTDSNDLTDSDEVEITVTVPAAHAGDDQTVPATSASGAFVLLDGSGSVGDIVAWEWSTDENPELASGETALVLFPLGSHVVTLTVTDEEENSDTDTVTITVVPPSGDPTATVDPDRSTVGSTVSFEIALFPAEEEVTIELVRDGADPIDLGTVETDLIGGATGSFVVPAAPGGDVQIRFTSGEAVATADFEIAPRIRVTPSTVSPGAQTTVELTGFAANDSVLIRWRVGTTWTSVGTVATGANGSGSTTVTVPVLAATGQNSVRGDGTGFAAQTNAVTVVVPSVTLDPTRTTVNNNVTYVIAGFPADSEVSITWRRPGGSTVAVGTANTDATGAATGTITVPATEGGNLNRVIFASGSVTVTTSFDVAPRIKVIPDTVSPGQQVEVSLRGYAKQETVRIRWLVNGVWVEIATVTTSNTGSANIIVTVPANANLGQNSVRGDGPIFRQQTNAVTVVAPPQ